LIVRKKSLGIGKQKIGKALKRYNILLVKLSVLEPLWQNKQIFKT